MGQLLACATPDGILVATDSRAEVFDTTGEEQFTTVDRLIRLTSHVVLASAGALEAQDLAREFAALVKDENLREFEAIIQAAVPFFSGKMDDFFRKACEKLPLNPVINMYLLIAGYSATTPDNPFRLHLIWDRLRPPRVEFTGDAYIFTMPRRLSLEYRLNQLVASRASLAEIAAFAKSAMENLAGQDSYVGPPFRFLSITKEGLTEI